MPTSAVPAVWGALHSLVDAATTTTVHFGPPMTESGNFLAIGYSDGGGEAVTSDTEWAALGQQKQEERFGIRCLAWVSSGDTDMQTRVTEVYALLDVVTGVLDADYTLNGTCRVAFVAEHSCLPEQDSSGSALRLPFTVNVAKRIGT